MSIRFAVKSNKSISPASRSVRFAAAGLLAAAGALTIVPPGLPSLARADAVDRLKPDHLKAVHAAVEALKLDRRSVSLPSPYVDNRGVMHVHSGLSHDSRSTIEEIVDAANKTGVKVIMFTEHPAPHYDYFKDGHRGLMKGVLLIPGAEYTGLQAYPRQSIPQDRETSPQSRVDAVRATKGQVFLCHLEERMDWDLAGLTGSEIYNVHADFKDEGRLLKMLRTPTGFTRLLAPYRDYPQEAMASLMDYPADYLQRYDQLCQKARLTGVAANDAHHNIAYRGIIRDDGKMQLVDALGKKLIAVDPAKLPALEPYLLKNAKKGDVAFNLDLDPYDRSFRFVCTHMLLKELSEQAVRDALEAGRAYVSFDWIGDPTGFNFQAVRGRDASEMGSEVRFEKGLGLRSVSPLPVRFRLIRNGREVYSALGRRFDRTLEEPGVYRLELWINVADTPQIWILSNPIYVRS